MGHCAYLYHHHPKIIPIIPYDPILVIPFGAQLVRVRFSVKQGGWEQVVWFRSVNSLSSSESVSSWEMWEGF